MRTPLTIYPTISKTVPCWQVTGDGRIPASISTSTSTATLEFDIDGSLSINAVRFEEDLIGTAQRGVAQDGLGNIWVIDPGAYTPSNTGSLFDGATGASILVRTIADSSAFVKLLRVPPAIHPIRPYLRATHVSSVQGLANTPKAAASPKALWKLLRYTVNFETLPYKIKSDENTTYESDRWFSISDVSPSMEFIKRQAGAYQFPDSAGLGSKTIPREIAQIMCKQKLTFMWHRVPDAGLFTSNGFFNGGKAVQIDSGLGRVNRYRWMGYNPGTLLFESWKPILRAMDCEPLVTRVQTDNMNFTPSWDVEFNFSYFEPPPAFASYPNVFYVPNTDILAASGTTTGFGAAGEYMDIVFGHNCVPRPDGSNRWYRMFVNKMPDIEPFWIYQTYDFNDLLRIWKV